MLVLQTAFVLPLLAYAVSVHGQHLHASQALLLGFAWVQLGLFSGALVLRVGRSRQVVPSFWCCGLHVASAGSMFQLGCSGFNFRPLCPVLIDTFSAFLHSALLELK